MNDDSFPEEEKYSTYPIFKDEDDEKLIKTMPGKDTKATDLEKKATLDELSTYTHSLWDKDAAEEYCKPFGFEPILRVWADDPDHPKGMHLNDPDKGPAVGATSEEIVAQIAEHEGVDVDEAYRLLGRGFRVRHMAELIETQLGLTEL